MLRTPLFLMLALLAAAAAPHEPRAAAEPHLSDDDAIALALRMAREAWPGTEAAFEPIAAFSGPSGATHVRLRQRIDGLEVYGGEIRLVFDAHGRLIHQSGSPPDGSSTMLRVSAQRAAAIAADEVGIAGPGPAEGVRSAAADRRTTFEREGFVAEPTARLVLVERDGALRTAWKVVLPSSFSAWHETLVDAVTGSIIEAMQQAAGAGPVGNTFEDDPADGAPVPREFGGVMAVPRDAWSAAGFTAGNNVIAGDDRDGDGDPIPSAIGEHPFLDAYQQSGGSDETADLDAAANNVFYWMNIAHDRFYDLGFREAAGNFQEDNFGAGGAGGDRVIALVQFGGETCDFFFPPCINDARFITQEEGEPAFATFTLYQPPFRYIDSSFASDVVLHEYVHGVSNRLIGVSLVGGVHAFALGEGWGDFFAASITDDPVFAEYLNGDEVRGLRTHSIDANPYTYADLCTIAPAGCNAHADGGIWAGALWDVREEMIARYGETAGIRKAEELALEGMMFTPPHPSFVDARDGVLEADLARSGAEHCALWVIFAERGLGTSATGSNIPPASMAAFDLPSHCINLGANSDGDGMPDAFEQARECLDASSDDASGDPDADGLPSIREWVGATGPCVADSDGDHCGDGAELGVNAMMGGERNPLDPWDFFDVTGDGRVDLADTMDVLTFFGASAGAEAALRDRFSPEAARPWLTAAEANGVDLHDALVSLKSFGHACVT